MLSPGSFGAVLSRAVAVLFGCFYPEGGFPIKQVDQGSGTKTTVAPAKNNSSENLGNPHMWGLNPDSQT